MFTPFKDGKVDVEALAATTRRQVDAGIDFLVPLGTTGETPTLSDEEKLLVFHTVKANAAGKPVVVGVGTNSLAGTQANMELLREAGGNMAIVSVGYNTYGHPAEETLDRLRESGYTVWRTDLNGTVEIAVRANNGKENAG